MTSDQAASYVSGAPTKSQALCLSPRQTLQLPASSGPISKTIRGPSAFGHLTGRLVPFSNSLAKPVIDAAVKVPVGRTYGREPARGRAFGHGHKAKDSREPVATCPPHSRFSEDIERSYTLRRLWRVQVVQACHRVDHTKEDSCLHPVVHQVGVGQASWGQVT